MLFRFWIFLLIPFYSFSQGIIVGDTTSSGVVYFNIKDTLVQGSAGFTYSVNIDLDNDNTNDISFLRFKNFSPHNFNMEIKYVKALTNVQFAYKGNSQYADTLSPGSLINDSLNWQSDSIRLRYTSQLPPPPWGPGYQVAGQFDAGSKYLGFRIIFPTDTVYGWFNLQMPTYIIKSYALQKKCNVISCVGLTELGVQELLIYPNPTADKIFINASNNIIFNSKVRLINSIGQTVVNMKLENSLDVSFLVNGLYFLEINAPEGLFRKKIVIQK